MNELLRERLFSLLAESSQITNEEMYSAYECFKEQVNKVSQSEQDYWKSLRILNTTRIELLFIESLYRYGQEKKCPEICLSKKSYPVY